MLAYSHQCSNAAPTDGQLRDGSQLSERKVKHQRCQFPVRKPVVSKTSEADIWLSSYDHLTNVGGQRGGCQQLTQPKGECFLLNKKEASSGIDPSE